MKVMSCFILVFKPILLNLATSVNRCLLISGFFIYFWSEIWRLFVLKSLNYDYLSQMASLPINSHKAFYITINDFQRTSFLSKKSVYQLRFLCFPRFHEVKCGLTMSWERRLALLLSENEHKYMYINFEQVSIKLKSKQKKFKTNSQIGQCTTNSSQQQLLVKLDVCLRASNRWNRRRWRMPKMEHEIKLFHSWVTCIPLHL